MSLSKCSRHTSAPLARSLLPQASETLREARTSSPQHELHGIRAMAKRHPHHLKYIAIFFHGLHSSSLIVQTKEQSLTRPETSSRAQFNRLSCYSITIQHCGHLTRVSPQ